VAAGPAVHGAAGAAVPAWAMISHAERSPGALAHGAAKSADIQRARHDLGAAGLRAARDLQAAARRQKRDAGRLLGVRPEARGR
jgi:hypothetical protein